MSGGLEPGVAIDALAVEVPLERLPADEVVDGAPEAGFVVLEQLPAGGGPGLAEIGVWEMTAGTATDVEVDEVFIVLAGSATITFVGDGTVVGDGAPAPIEVRAGSVVRLVAGMRTIWTVHERVRKLSIA